MKKHPHDPSEKSIARWINEGGAPQGVDRSVHKRPGDQVAKLIVDTPRGAPSPHILKMRKRDHGVPGAAKK